MSESRVVIKGTVENKPDSGAAAVRERYEMRFSTARKMVEPKYSGTLEANRATAGRPVTKVRLREKRGQPLIFGMNGSGDKGDSKGENRPAAPHFRPRI